MTHEDEEARVRDALARLLRDHPPATTPELEFWGAQFDAGLAFVDLPPACGGLGVSSHWRGVVEQALADAGASFENVRRNPVGHGLCADTLAMFGTPHQCDRYLRMLFTAEEIWCQLFSEPGAGSDVASLATRAERAGDDWVVRGQKVWSSFAKQSARGLLIARTDPDVPKHAGLTAFVLDTHAPGVDIRPLVEMTGGTHFNEVFLEDVHVPDTDRIGDVDGGWRVVTGTLANERALLTGTGAERSSTPIEDVLRLWGESTQQDPLTRDALVRVWIESECLRLGNARAAAAVELGRPEPDGAVRKLHNAELNQRIYEVCIRILGAAGMVERPGGGRQTYNDSDGAITWAFLRSRANTIEGGTSEVMRNIAGERVLGLPAEARADKGVPWSQMLRN